MTMCPLCAIVHEKNPVPLLIDERLLDRMPPECNHGCISWPGGGMFMCRACRLGHCGPYQFVLEAPRRLRCFPGLGKEAEGDC